MTMVQTCFVTPPNASTAILTRSLIRDLAYNNTLTRPADRYVCHFHKRQRCRMDQKLNECRKRESATSDRIVHVYLCFCLCTIFFFFFWLRIYTRVRVRIFDKCCRNCSRPYRDSLDGWWIMSTIIFGWSNKIHLSASNKTVSFRFYKPVLSIEILFFFCLISIIVVVVRRRDRRLLSLLWILL